MKFFLANLSTGMVRTNIDTNAPFRRKHSGSSTDGVTTYKTNNDKVTSKYVQSCDSTEGLYVHNNVPKFRFYVDGNRPGIPTDFITPVANIIYTSNRTEMAILSMNQYFICWQKL